MAERKILNATCQRLWIIENLSILVSGFCYCDNLKDRYFLGEAVHTHLPSLHTFTHLNISNYNPCFQLTNQ